MTRITYKQIASRLSFAVAAAIAGCTLQTMSSDVQQIPPAPGPTSLTSVDSDVFPSYPPLPESAGMPSSTMPLPGAFTLDPIDPVAAATDDFLGEQPDDAPVKILPDIASETPATQATPETLDAADAQRLTPDQLIPTLPYSTDPAPPMHGKTPLLRPNPSPFPPQIITQYYPEIVYVPQYYYCPLPLFQPRPIFEYPIIIRHRREICPGVFIDVRFPATHRPPSLADGHHHDNRDHHPDPHNTGRGSPTVAKTPAPSTGRGPAGSPPAGSNTLQRIVTSQGTTIFIQPSPPRGTPGEVIRRPAAARQLTQTTPPKAAPTAKTPPAHTVQTPTLPPTVAQQTAKPTSKTSAAGPKPPPVVQARTETAQPANQRTAENYTAPVIPAAKPIAKPAPQIATPAPRPKPLDTAPPNPLVQAAPQISPPPPPKPQVIASPKVDAPRVVQADRTPPPAPKPPAPAPVVIAPTPRVIAPPLPRPIESVAVRPQVTERASAPAAPIQISAPRASIAPPPPPAASARSDSGTSGPQAGERDGRNNRLR